jgi:hypothetical protein
MLCIADLTEANYVIFVLKIFFTPYVVSKLSRLTTAP